MHSQTKTAHVVARALTVRASVVGALFTCTHMYAYVRKPMRDLFANPG
jgi:hypothetical protein